MSGNRHHTAQSQPAYEPPSLDIGLGWRLLVVGLLLTAVAALSVRSVCLPDVPGARESGFGVRHEQHGSQWYHCEPWIRRTLGD